MNARLTLACLACALAACPKSELGTKADREAAPVDAGAPMDPEEQRVRAEVTTLSADARSWSHAVDEKLWAHWTTGVPLDLTPLASRKTALLEPRRRADLRTAIERGWGDPSRLERLATFLDSEANALALTEQTDALTGLEATLTFSFEGKEVRWRELNRLLANEKSAIKRKALWAASLRAAERLDLALAARDARRAELLAPKSLLEADAELRDVDPQQMRRLAEGVLTLTDRAWRQTLERLNATDTRLPIASLTRADLPRLLRVPADVDLAFGKKELAQRAVTTLGAIGLYGKPGLTLDLSEAIKKNPLPLTVTPGGPADVRTSFRPLGGLRDQQLLLSELGVALALEHVSTGRFEDERLGDTALAQASGELFASLVMEPTWLEAQGLGAPARAAVVDAAAALRLFQARRAAAAYLARVDCLEHPDVQVRQRAAQLFTRALGVAHQEADMVRLRIDTDDALRSASTLRAMLSADVLRGRLHAHAGQAWFTTPVTGPALTDLWSPGSSVPLEHRVAMLGDAITAFVTRTNELTPTGAPDGGWPIAEWAQPKEGPFSTARPWPRRRLMLDGGAPFVPDAGTSPAWVPRPWPQPKRLSLDGGVPPPSDAGKEP